MALIVAAVFGKQRSVCSGAGEAAAFGVAAGSVPPSAGHAVSATSTAAAPAASLLDDANLIDTLLHQASFSYSATGRVADTNLSFQHVGGHGATQLAPNTMQQKRRERARQLHMQLTEQAAWSRAEQHVLHAETLPTLPPSFTKAADAGLRVCGGVHLVGPGYSTLIAMVPTVRTVQCIAEDDELISSPRAYRYDARHSHHNKAYMMTEQAASMPVASLPLPTRGSTAVAPPTATMTRLHPDVQRRVQPLLDSVRASALVDVGALPDDVCEALRAHAAALRRGGNDGGGCDDGGGDDGDGARERRVEDDASGGQVNEDGRDASAGEAAEAGAAERSASPMSLTPQAPRRHTSKPSGTWPFRSVDRDAAARVQAARAGLPSAATSSAAQRVAKYEPRYTVVQPRVTGGYMKPPPSTLSPRRRHDTQCTTAAASAAASAHGMPYALSSTMTNVTTSASHGTATTPTVDNNSSYNTASAHGPVNDKDGHDAQQQQQQQQLNNNNNNNNNNSNTAAMRICSVTTPSLAATERDDAASLAATMTMMLDTTSRFSTTSTAVGCGDAGDDAGSAVRSRCASGHRPVRRGMQQAHDQRQQPQQALQQAPRTAALVRHGSGATTVAGGEGGGAGVSETEDSAAARAAAAAARLRYKHNVKGSSMFLSRTSRSSSPSLSRRQQRRCRPHTTHKDNNDDDDDDHTDDDAYDAPAASSSAGCYWPYPDVRSTTRRVRCAVRFAHSVTHRRRAPLVAGVPVGAYDVTTDVSAQRHCTVDMRYTTSRETHWTSRTRAPPTGTAAAGGGGGSTLDVERAWRATLPSAHTARLSPRVDVTRHDQQQQPRQQQREQPLRGVSVEANLSYPPPTLGSAAALARVRAFDKMRSRDDVTRDAAAAAVATAPERTQRRGARGSAFAGTRGAGDDRDDYDGVNGTSDEDDAAAAAAAITSPRTRAAHIHARAPGHKPLYTASVHTELGNVASLALVRPRVRCTANLASAARQDMSAASAVAGSDDKKGSGRRLPPLAQDVVYDTAAARAHIEPRVRGDPMMATAVSREVRARHTRDGHNGQAATTTTTARTNAGAASTTAMTTAAMAALSLPTTATTATTAATTDATYSFAAVDAALRPHPKLVPDFDKQITKETQFAGHRVVSERWLRTHPTAPGPGSYTVSYTQVE